MCPNNSRLPIIIILIHLIGSIPSFAQLSNFDIDYPHKGEVAKIQFDNSGYFWFHDDKDFYKYNGHQIDQVGKILKPDVRQNLYFIFKEAITNAIKHSNGDEVKIKLYKENERLILSIKDNGTPGTQLPSDGLGLASIKSRAKMINGSVSIQTSPNYEVRVVI